MAEWNCATDRMNRAVLEAFLADRHAARQDEMKARAEGKPPPARPRLLYTACPCCESVLRISSPETAGCPNCEETPCRR